jgi:hypothetical protein
MQAMTMVGHRPRQIELGTWVILENSSWDYLPPMSQGRLAPDSISGAFFSLRLFGARQAMKPFKILYRCRKCENEFDSGSETLDAATWQRTSRLIEYRVCPNCLAINRCPRDDAILKDAS